MHALKSTLLVGLIALAPSLAMAQAPGSVPGSATASPQNRDAGRADRQARKAERQARFKAADTNGDGALSRAEADAAGLKGIAKRFDVIDSNKDGRVTREEMRTARQAHKGQRGKRGQRGADAGTGTPSIR
ncbi:MAG: hypothetical protein JNM79_04125 [Burkholderiales bacterium]|nr:hypothetical protein [Burkholderiales bacterium]